MKGLAPSSGATRPKKFGLIGSARLIVFATLFLKEKLAWNHLVAFAFLGAAAYFAFAFKAGEAASHGA